MAFTDAWRSVTGHAGTVTTEERRYRLGTLRPPVEVSGVHRDATGVDHALLGGWVELFFVETLSHRAGLHAAEFARARRPGQPTSNAIYRRIGFEPVVDQVRIDFAVDG
jgi:hypothetical protein